MVRVGGKTLTRFGALLLGGAALTALSASAFAADLGSYKDDEVVEYAGRKLEVSGSVALTTDYVFRGFSQTDQEPAVQGTVDVTYGMLYAGVFATNVDFNDGDEASIEVDLYAGIKPTWNGVTFDLGFIYYAYPGADDDLDYDYVEIKGGVSGTLFNMLNAGVTVYYSPEYTGDTGEVWTIEGSLSKTLFTHRGVTFDLSGVVGTVEFDEDEFDDYVYWNVGLTATFKEKYSIDVRYHDTDVDDSYLADERIVGTAKIAF